MKHKLFGIVFLAVLSCSTCLGQTSFQGLTPGKSMKADVERVLGQSVRDVSETLSEYKSGQEMGQIFVQYRKGSFIIERIELVYSDAIARATALHSLNLAAQPIASQTNSKGRLEEYFSPASLVLSYAGANTDSGINRVGYYSQDLFASVTTGMNMAQPASPSGPSGPANLAAAGPIPPPPPTMLSHGANSIQLAGETDMRVRLLTPINTATSRKGDKISAQVIDPPAYAGETMEGVIRESKSGAKLNGKSVLNFSFDTLGNAGRAQPVQANVKSLTNSKGKQDVDEEGQIIKKKNSFGKLAAGTAIGALIGGLAGGGRGAAIGAGVGAVASLVLIEVAVDGANVSFDPGTEFILSVKPR